MINFSKKAFAPLAEQRHRGGKTLAVTMNF